MSTKKAIAYGCFVGLLSCVFRVAEDVGFPRWLSECLALGIGIQLGGNLVLRLLDESQP